MWHCVDTVNGYSYIHPTRQKPGPYTRNWNQRHCKTTKNSSYSILMVKANIAVLGNYTLLCTIESSDFSGSLWVRWIWFGIEILRLVYKKPFFKLLSVFLWISPFAFFEIGHMGYQKSVFLRYCNFKNVPYSCLKIFFKFFLPEKLIF